MVTYFIVEVVFEKGKPMSWAYTKYIDAIRTYEEEIERLHEIGATNVILWCVQEDGTYLVRSYA